jgi:hypothetical protein
MTMRNQRRHNQRISTMVMSGIGIAATAGATLVFLLNLPDLMRYFRIRRM